MPGVGESPVFGSVDAERQYVPIFDWKGTQPGLDADRVIILGMSYGGYWATKLAHVFADRILAAVNWGGGTHTFFYARLVPALGQHEKLLDGFRPITRSNGRRSIDEYIERVAGFSLVDQGVLNGPHASMLPVNGRDDQQVPVDDLLLLLDYGKPKATILEWIKCVARMSR